MKNDNKPVEDWVHFQAPGGAIVVLVIVFIFLLICLKIYFGD